MTKSHSGLMPDDELVFPERFPFGNHAVMRNWSSEERSDEGSSVFAERKSELEL